MRPELHAWVNRLRIEQSRGFSDHDALQLASAIESLSARVEELEREAARLKGLLADHLNDETRITDLVIADGGLNLGLEGGAAKLLAESLAQSFAEGKGVNYIEMRFESKVALPGQRFVVTVQRVKGKTPAECRTDAERERDELRARLEKLENK